MAYYGPPFQLGDVWGQGEDGGDFRLMSGSFKWYSRAVIQRGDIHVPMTPWYAGEMSAEWHERMYLRWLLSPWPVGMAEANRLALAADPESWPRLKRALRRTRTREEKCGESRAVQAAADLF